MLEKLLEKNTSIDEAIKKFKPETTQERLQDIVKAVQFCIRENSKFLVPITNPDAEAGQEYMIRTTYSPEGKLYAVAFTNEEEIEKGAETFTEETAKASGVYYDPGPDIMKLLLK